jgi:hypothetical protein
MVQSTRTCRYRRCAWFVLSLPLRPLLLPPASALKGCSRDVQPMAAARRLRVLVRELCRCGAAYIEHKLTRKDWFVGHRGRVTLVVLRSTTCATLARSIYAMLVRRMGNGLSALCTCAALCHTTLQVPSMPSWLESSTPRWQRIHTHSLCRHIYTPNLVVHLQHEEYGCHLQNAKSSSDQLVLTAKSLLAASPRTKISPIAPHGPKIPSSAKHLPLLRGAGPMALMLWLNG